MPSEQKIACGTELAGAELVDQMPPLVVELFGMGFLTLESDVAKPMTDWLRGHGIEVKQDRRDRRASTRSGGWPDLTFCVAGTAFAIEVKRPGRRSGSPEHLKRQRGCQARLKANGWKVAECQSVTELCDFIQKSLPVTVLWA
ncbi:MAG TPA: hypothetical protein VLK33_05190 [Terriglobales bacterium]|nr:hypothetical protein [Terriglobales bacterium]